MAKSSDSYRCVREYIKKDGTKTYYAEVRRLHGKPLRKKCRTPNEAKNWVRSTESALLEGRILPETKAKKYTLHDLIEQYKSLHLSKFPKRLRDQSIHLKWWDEQYGKKLLSDITPALLAEAKNKLLNEMTPRKTLYFDN